MLFFKRLEHWVKWLNELKVTSSHSDAALTLLDALNPYLGLVINKHSNMEDEEPDAAWGLMRTVRMAMLSNHDAAAAEPEIRRIMLR